MLDPKRTLRTFQENGIAFFAGVPDSLLKHFCACVDETLGKEQHVITANEGGAIALAAGHHLASGSVPLVYMQNSGLGNTVNPLLSLTDPEVYSIPMILMVGWRGEPGLKDEPQHVKQGPVTPSLLEAMQIPYEVLPETDEEAIGVIENIVEIAKEKRAPLALLVRKGTFDTYERKLSSAPQATLPTREHSLETILDTLPDDTVYVGSTGKLSRELFELREKRGEGHEKDFLTVGSMGHASQIALGIAESKPEKTIVCLDGDGAALMHLGGMATIGERQPKNYIHIVINNGAHESVGGQTITNRGIDFVSLAKSIGYKHACSMSSTEELSACLKEIESTSKPALIDCRTKTGSRENLGRPTTSPERNKIDFMQYLNK